MTVIQPDCPYIECTCPLKALLELQICKNDQTTEDVSSRSNTVKDTQPDPGLNLLMKMRMRPA